MEEIIERLTKEKLNLNKEHAQTLLLKDKRINQLL